jgi:diaphanous 1
MLARLKMGHVEIREAVLRIDDDRLSIDNLKALKHYAPTADEVGI